MPGQHNKHDLSRGDVAAWGLEQRMAGGHRHAPPPWVTRSRRGFFGYYDDSRGIYLPRAEFPLRNQSHTGVPAIRGRSYTCGMHAHQRERDSARRLLVLSRMHLTGGTRCMCLSMRAPLAVFFSPMAFCARFRVFGAREELSGGATRAAAKSVVLSVRKQLPLILLSPPSDSPSGPQCMRHDT